MQKLYGEYLNVVKKILRYVVGMKDLALKYSKFLSFVLLGFSNFDNEANRNDRKSTFGYVFSICSGTIPWASKKHPTSSLSTIKVEYYAISIVIQETIWLRHLLKEIRYEKSYPY